MSSASKIEWTDATWNPIVGCSILSPGCTNCYAMTMAARIEKMASSPMAAHVNVQTHYAGTTQKSKAGAVWTGKVARAPDHIFTAPLRWKKPRRIFVNSMGDLFHESIPDKDIDDAFAVMALCPQHTFQVLTKRAQRMREYMTTDRRDAWSRAADPLGDWAPLSPQEYANRAHIVESVPTLRGNSWTSVFSRWPLPNVWLGVSCERQQEADERIPLLLQTPAAVRFISAEPLLGPIDLSEIPVSGDIRPDRPIFERPSLDWVIVGGESGPNARPMHPQWARDIRDQCAAAGVAFFFKQWGEHGRVGDQVGVDHLPQDADLMTRVGKKAAGRLLDGKEHNAFPVIDSSVSHSGLSSVDSKNREATR